ncbi:Mid1-interacting protein 1-like [Orchesella cincta]|uniref:Mid1-interacting protein 1-like n=1 Tax=Orchesella cincta TaxID=48709 RepID=A0A1D2MMC5_ORCCI|nr:Mid1-interacting protein 1-like [Orchesella cincta]
MTTLDTESGICYNNCCTGSENTENSSTRSSTCNGSANSRRKQTRWDQPEPNHSNGSLLSTMERFVQTVEDMNETILVPCRLMDVKFDHTIVQTPEKDSVSNGHIVKSAAAGIDKAAAGKRLLASLNGTDLFQFYTMLNSVKNNLMWGSHGQNQNQRSTSNQSSTISTSSSASSVVSSSASSTSSLSQVSQGQSSEVKGHARRPSTVSTTSSASASDTEFSELNEDSGVEAEHEEEYSHSMADTFHHHLNGLQQCLCDLTLAADYVTTRYSSDLGGTF